MQVPLAFLELRTLMLDILINTDRDLSFLKNIDAVYDEATWRAGSECTIINDSWSTFINCHSTNPAVKFKLKLKQLKFNLKNWRRSINITESAAAIELREKIDEIDRRVELSPLSATVVDVRIEKVKLIAEMENRKLKDLRQKAKMKWDLEGDENSSFFHGIINNRRNRARINGLAIEGEWVTDLIPIKSHILHFFETKFKEPSQTFFLHVFRGEEQKHLLGAKVERDKVPISHLQFADDALIVGHWSLSNAKNLSIILTCFHLASGLKVNFSKSKLFGIGVLSSELNSIASSIGCQPSLLPCTYLGFPLVQTCQDDAIDLV
ncbi:hypothetical protein Tco_0109041 [Tanacetum coccineum]